MEEENTEEVEEETEEVELVAGEDEDYYRDEEGSTVYFPNVYELPVSVKNRLMRESNRWSDVSGEDENDEDVNVESFNSVDRSEEDN